MVFSKGVALIFLHNILFRPYYFNSWSDYYSGPNIQPNISGLNQINQYPELKESNFYVYQVIFSTATETQGDGGAILIKINANVLIESSHFIQCHAQGMGGALYLFNGDGNCYLKRVCSINCYANDFHFCCMKNYIGCVDHSSIAKLDKKGGNIILQSKSLLLKYNNISKNKCSDGSLYCYPPLNCSITYTSFENNTSSSSSLIFFDNKKNEIVTCNIIENYGKKSIIFVYGSISISNSCIKENNQNSMMFYLIDNSAKVIINNCTIDKTENNGIGTVTIEVKAIESFINNLENDECLSKKNSTFNRKSNCICKTFSLKRNIWFMNRREDDFLIILN